MVKLFYKVESLAILLFAAFIYSTFEIKYLTFFIFLLAPDISMAGYLINKNIGAFFYNLGHSYSLGLLLVFAGMFSDGSPVFFIPDGAYLGFAGVIIIAHTALDRLLGFGLKYPSGFKVTHLQRI